MRDLLVGAGLLVIAGGGVLMAMGVDGGLTVVVIGAFILVLGVWR